MVYLLGEKVRYNDMKQAIHPEYKETVVKCACGEEYVTKSTKQNLKVDICSSAIRSIPASRSLLIAADV